MKAISLDSSSGYDQPQRPKKKCVCKRGSQKGERGKVRGEGGGEQLCWGYCCILSQRGNKVLIFRFRKRLPSWRFSVPSVLVTEPGEPTEHPPPPPQEPSTMVPKCTLGCPENNLTCSPDSHWDALELQPFAQGYPLALARALTERRLLIRHLNHLYIIVLWHNGPNVL